MPAKVRVLVLSLSGVELRARNCDLSSLSVQGPLGSSWSFDLATKSNGDVSMTIHARFPPSLVARFQQTAAVDAAATVIFSTVDGVDSSSCDFTRDASCNFIPDAVHDRPFQLTDFLPDVTEQACASYEIKGILNVNNTSLLDGKSLSVRCFLCISGVSMRPVRALVPSSSSAVAALRHSAAQKTAPSKYISLAPRLVPSHFIADARSQTGIVGIRNQGATCYLNSVLQTLFHTRLFRKLVYEAPVEWRLLSEIPEKCVVVNAASEVMHIDDDGALQGAASSAAPIAAASNFHIQWETAATLLMNTRHAGDPGDSDFCLSGAHDRHRSAEAALASLVNEQIKRVDAGANTNDVAKSVGVSDRTRVVAALQQMFVELEGAAPGAASTKHLTASFGWDVGDAFVQNDVQELLRVLIDRIDDTLARTPLRECISHLFRGEACTRTVAPSLRYASEPRIETFADVQLPVRGHPDVYSSLASLVADESMTGDNQVAVGVDKVDGSRSMRFLRLPPVLHLQLMRFSLDAGLNKVKVNTRFEFPDTLLMDDFMVQQPERGELLQQQAAKRERERESRRQDERAANSSGGASGASNEVVLDHPDSSAPAAVAGKRSSRRGRARGGGDPAVPVDGSDASVAAGAPKMDIADHLTNVPVSAQAALRACEAAEAATRSETNLYRLHSVLVHSGSVNGGHYYAFVRPRLGMDDAEARNKALQLWVQSLHSSALAEKRRADCVAAPSLAPRTSTGACEMRTEEVALVKADVIELESDGGASDVDDFSSAAAGAKRASDDAAVSTWSKSREWVATLFPSSGARSSTLQNNPWTATAAYVESSGALSANDTEWESVVADAGSTSANAAYTSLAVPSVVVPAARRPDRDATSLCSTSFAVPVDNYEHDPLLCDSINGASAILTASMPDVAAAEDVMQAAPDPSYLSSTRPPTDWAAPGVSWGGWFKVNDDKVMPVTNAEAGSSNFGSGSTDDKSGTSAYFLVYVREDAVGAVMAPFLPTLPPATGACAAIRGDIASSTPQVESTDTTESDSVSERAFVKSNAANHRSLRRGKGCRGGASTTRGSRTKVASARGTILATDAESSAGTRPALILSSACSNVDLCQAAEDCLLALPVMSKPAAGVAKATVEWLLPQPQHLLHLQALSARSAALLSRCAEEGRNAGAAKKPFFKTRKSDADRSRAVNGTDITKFFQSKPPIVANTREDADFEEVPDDGVIELEDCPAAAAAGVAAAAAIFVDGDDGDAIEEQAADVLAAGLRDWKRSDYFVSSQVPVPWLVVRRVLAGQRIQAAVAAREARELHSARAAGHALLFVVSEAHQAVAPFLQARAEDGRPGSGGVAAAAGDFSLSHDEHVLDAMPLQHAFRMRLPLSTREHELHRAVGQHLGIPPASFRLRFGAKRGEGEWRPDRLVCAANEPSISSAEGDSVVCGWNTFPMEATYFLDRRWLQRGGTQPPRMKPACASVGAAIGAGALSSAVNSLGCAQPIPAFPPIENSVSAARALPEADVVNPSWSTFVLNAQGVDVSLAGLLLAPVPTHSTDGDTATDDIIDKELAVLSFAALDTAASFGMYSFDARSCKPATELIKIHKRATVAPNSGNQNPSVARSLMQGVEAMALLSAVPAAPWAAHELLARRASLAASANGSCAGQAFAGAAYVQESSEHLLAWKSLLSHEKGDLGAARLLTPATSNQTTLESYSNQCSAVLFLEFLPGFADRLSYHIKTCAAELQGCAGDAHRAQMDADDQSNSAALASVPVGALKNDTKPPHPMWHHLEPVLPLLDQNAAAWQQVMLCRMLTHNTWFSVAAAWTPWARFWVQHVASGRASLQLQSWITFSMAMLTDLRNGSDMLNELSLPQHDAAAGSCSPYVSALVPNFRLVPMVSLSVYRALTKPQERSAHAAVLGAAMPSSAVSVGDSTVPVGALFPQFMPAVSLPAEGGVSFVGTVTIPALCTVAELKTSLAQWIGLVPILPTVADAELSAWCYGASARCETATTSVTTSNKDGTAATSPTRFADANVARSARDIAKLAADRLLVHEHIGHERHLPLPATYNSTPIGMTIIDDNEGFAPFFNVPSLSTHKKNVAGVKPLTSSDGILSLCASHGDVLVISYKDEDVLSWRQSAAACKVQPYDVRRASIASVKNLPRDKTQAAGAGKADNDDLEFSEGDHPVIGQKRSRPVGSERDDIVVLSDSDEEVTAGDRKKIRSAATTHEAVPLASSYVAVVESVPEILAVSGGKVLRKRKAKKADAAEGSNDDDYQAAVAASLADVKMFTAAADVVSSRGKSIAQGRQGEQLQKLWEVLNIAGPLPQLLGVNGGLYKRIKVQCWPLEAQFLFVPTSLHGSAVSCSSFSSSSACLQDDNLEWARKLAIGNHKAAGSVIVEMNAQPSQVQTDTLDAPAQDFDGTIISDVLARGHLLSLPRPWRRLCSALGDSIISCVAIAILSAVAAVEAAIDTATESDMDACSLISTAVSSVTESFATNTSEVLECILPNAATSLKLFFDQTGVEYDAVGLLLDTPPSLPAAGAVSNTRLLTGRARGWDLAFTLLCGVHADDTVGSHLPPVLMPLNELFLGVKSSFADVQRAIASVITHRAAASGLAAVASRLSGVSTVLLATGASLMTVEDSGCGARGTGSFRSLNRVQLLHLTLQSISNNGRSSACSSSLTHSGSKGPSGNHADAVSFELRLRDAACSVSKHIENIMQGSLPLSSACILLYRVHGPDAWPRVAIERINYDRFADDGDLGNDSDETAAGKRMLTRNSAATSTSSLTSSIVSTVLCKGVGIGPAAQRYEGGRAFVWEPRSLAFSLGSGTTSARDVFKGTVRIAVAWAGMDAISLMSSKRALRNSSAAGGVLRPHIPELPMTLMVDVSTVSSQKEFKQAIRVALAEHEFFVSGGSAIESDGSLTLPATPREPSKAQLRFRLSIHRLVYACRGAATIPPIASLFSKLPQVGGVAPNATGSRNLPDCALLVNASIVALINSNDSFNSIRTVLAAASRKDWLVDSTGGSPLAAAYYQSLRLRGFTDINSESLCSRAIVVAEPVPFWEPMLSSSHFGCTCSSAAISDDAGSIGDDGDIAKGESGPPNSAVQAECKLPEIPKAAMPADLEAPVIPKIVCTCCEIKPGSASLVGLEWLAVSLKDFNQQQSGAAPLQCIGSDAATGSRGITGLFGLHPGVQATKKLPSNVGLPSLSHGSSTTGLVPRRTVLIPVSRDQKMLQVVLYAAVRLGLVSGCAASVIAQSIVSRDTAKGFFGWKWQVEGSTSAASVPGAAMSSQAQEDLAISLISSGILTVGSLGDDACAQTPAELRRLLGTSIGTFLQRDAGVSYCAADASAISEAPPLPPPPSTTTLRELNDAAVGGGPAAVAPKSLLGADIKPKARDRLTLWFLGDDAAGSMPQAAPPLPDSKCSSSSALHFLPECAAYHAAAEAAGVRLESRVVVAEEARVAVVALPWLHLHRRRHAVSSAGGGAAAAPHSSSSSSIAPSHDELPRDDPHADLVSLTGGHVMAASQLAAVGSTATSAATSFFELERAANGDKAALSSEELHLGLLPAHRAMADEAAAALAASVAAAAARKAAEDSAIDVDDADAIPAPPPPAAGSGKSSLLAAFRKKEQGVKIF